MTSTLQQEASRKLRYSAQTTMRIAQRLYENGYITYMRTDSTTLSESALVAARRQATELYGADYVPEKPRTYERKVKNAQEAHEAIRPSGDSFRTPQGAAGRAHRDEFALYELIWMRTIASQMKDAQGQTVSLRIAGTSSCGREGGVRRVRHGDHVPRLPRRVRGGPRHRRHGDSRRGRAAPAERRRGRRGSSSSELEPQGHETNPPARYTEATLVRTLEELGIGRPSTYASIIGTILDRGYVFKQGTALVPSFLAFSVVDAARAALRPARRLRLHGVAWRTTSTASPRATSRPHRLAAPASTSANDGNGPARARLRPRRDRREGDQLDPARGDSGIVLRVGRYGPYLERDDQRANIPDDLVPDELTVEKAEELLAQPSGDRELGIDPETGREIVARTGRYGPYVTEVARGGLEGQAAHRVALQVDVARHDHARRGAAAALAAARARRRRRRRGGDGAERPLRAVRRSRARRRARSSRRSSSSRSRSTRRWRCWRSRSSAAAAARRSRR